MEWTSQLEVQGNVYYRFGRPSENKLSTNVCFNRKNFFIFFGNIGNWPRGDTEILKQILKHCNREDITHPWSYQAYIPQIQVWGKMQLYTKYFITMTRYIGLPFALTLM